MTGEVSILSVGHGDTTLKFNSNDPADVERAKRIVEDMLKRGYALLIEVGKDKESGEPIYRRARSFDAKTCEYVIAGDPIIDEQRPKAAPEVVPLMKPIRLKKDGAPDMRGRHNRTKDRRVSAKTHSAVAVGRISGG